MQRRTDSHGNVEPSSTAGDIVRQRTVEIGRPPIPARVAPDWRATHQRSPLTYFQQLPSWLLSLILHLGLMLLLASLVVPYGKQTRLAQLLVTFGQEPNHDLKLSLAPIVVEAPQARELDENQAAEGISAVQEPTADSSPPPLVTDENHLDLQKVSKVLSSFFRGRTVQEQPGTRMVRIEPVARVESTFDWSRHEAAESQRHDDVVEDFIRYDIGELRGQAGRDAARRFQRLGSSAIPALVRGLNRSASIHASCPVGVISAKLVNELRSTDDPRLIDYALKHLGRNVPEDAPHRARVHALRNQLQVELRQRDERIRQRLGELGWSVDQGVIRRIASLYLADHGELRTALRDNDDARRKAATLAVLLRSDEFNSAAQAQLGLTIADLIDRTSDPQQRDLLQQASRRLAGQPDWVTALNGADWRAFWEHRIRVQMMSGLDAAQQVRELRSRDPDNRRAVVEAIILSNESISDSLKYQMSDLIIGDLNSASSETVEIAHQALVKLAGGEDVGGRSAEAWREYWTHTHFERTVVPRSETYLRQAQFLQQRGNREAAAEKYRQLIERFPDTPAAKSAAERLPSIMRRNRP